MNKLIKKAFTLIELLVVIAIVGILSGLIIVGMNGMTQKATIAKVQVFSNSLRNSLMMNLVSEWKFDGSGIADGGNATTAYTQDTWKMGNNCAIGGTPKVYSNNNCIFGSCLNFNGSTDYLNCGTGSSLNISGNKITIEVWVNPSLLTEEYFISKFPGDTVTSGYNFLITSSNIYFRLGDGASRFEFSPTHGMSINNWYHFVATYDGALMKIYKNGVAISGNTPFTGNIATNANPVIIGRSVSSSYYFNGLIDNVRIYDSATSISQIKENYYEGINNLLITGQINKEEYQARIEELATVKRY